jgi:hypothetical protein
VEKKLLPSVGGVDCGWVDIGVRAQRFVTGDLETDGILAEVDFERTELVEAGARAEHLQGFEIVIDGSRSDRQGDMSKGFVGMRAMCY